MSRLVAACGRGFRRALRLAWWGLLLLPFLAMPMGAGIEYSNSPNFCGSCHIMEPFYDAWKAGSHKDVACTKCHYPPDLEGKLWVKFQGLAQLVSYVTKTESTRPSAHVHDGSCTQCHALDTLKGDTDFDGIRFRHDAHLNAARPGQELKCTSCHAQTTRDTHMAVDKSACNLCHFKDQKPGEAVGGCTACHTLPQKSVAGASIAFEHGGVATRGLACASCHKDATRGAGDVVRVRCLQCHADPAALAEYDVARSDPQAKDKLHFAHVKAAAVDCRSCHEEIEHGAASRKSASPHSGGSQDCAACHKDRHEPQAEFGAGRGAKLATGKPDFMFHLGMSCESCHEAFAAAGDDAGGGCFACHGSGVRGMLEGWKSSLGEWHAALSGDVAKAEAALGADAPAEARSKLADVKADLAYVKKAGGVHNMLFSAEIFRGGRAAVEGALASANKSIDFTALTVPKDASDCRSCHLGVERKTGTLGGYDFPHGPHLAKANLSCDDCHATSGPHGKVEMTLDRCTDCHHTEEDGCAKCHRGTAEFYEGRGLPRIAQIPSPKASQVACSICHSDRASKDQLGLARKMCVECHDEKYGPTLDAWMKEETALLAELASALDAARLAVVEADRRAAGYDDARKAVTDAETTLALLRKNRFVHNPELARAGAKDALERLKAAVAAVAPK